jgi:hypothetical protein
MKQPPLSIAPPGVSLPSTQQMEEACNKHNIINGEAKYSHISWLVGSCKKQDVCMDNLGHPAILLCGNHRIRPSTTAKQPATSNPAITPLEVREIERNSIMIHCKGKQAVHATPKHERHLIREFARQWWHSCIKVSSCGDKLEGKPLIHRLSQPHQNSADLNTTRKEEVQRPSNTGFSNWTRARGTTPGNVVSTNNKGRSNNRGSTREVESDSNRGIINDRGRIKHDWSGGNFLAISSVCLKEWLNVQLEKDRRKSWWMIISPPPNN